MQLIVFSFNYSDLSIKSFGKTPGTPPVIVMGSDQA